MNRILQILIPFILCVSITCCSQSTYDYFMLNVVTAGWETILYVNENPVYEGGSKYSSVKEVSMWLKEGKNNIKITTQKVEADPFWESCQIVFAKVKDLKSGEPQIIYEFFEESPTKDYYEKEFTINTNNSIPLILEIADIIEFNDNEKKEIYCVISEFRSVIEERNYEKIDNFNIYIWRDNKFPPNMTKNLEKINKINNDNFNTIFSYAELVIQQEKLENLRFTVGKKTVLVTLDNRYSEMDKDNFVLYAGRDPNLNTEGYQVRIAFDQMVFIKVSGQWKLIKT